MRENHDISDTDYIDTNYTHVWVNHDPTDSYGIN